MGNWRFFLSTVLIIFPAFLAKADEYFPGKYISWERFNELSLAFEKAWHPPTNGEAELWELLKHTEPEAVAALRSQLSCPCRVSTSTYTPELLLEPGEDIPSPDGLMGLRVVRQSEVNVRGNRHLISSIATYRWNPNAKHLELRAGADALRIRVELRTTAPGQKFVGSKNFMGFSWFAHRGNDGKLQLRPGHYVKAGFSTPATATHDGFFMGGVTPCALANHCNVCHHRTERNMLESRPLSFFEKDQALIEFLEVTDQQHRLSASDREKLWELLVHPNKIPILELLSALPKD